VEEREESLVEEREDTLVVEDREESLHCKKIHVGIFQIST
jgi:hypothetical protein